MMKLLLEMDKDHQLDVNAQTSVGLTPLHVAIKELWRCQDVALFETLIKAGADVCILVYSILMLNILLALNTPMSVSSQR